MERLQYQALKEATGAVQGSSIEKVDMIAGVEDVDTIMRANQACFIARSMADPAGVGDIYRKKRRAGTGGPGTSGGYHKCTKVRTALHLLPTGCWPV